MRITFTQRHEVRQGDGKGPVYELGQSYDFNGPVAETYARKYIARGYAVIAAVEEMPRSARARAAQRPLSTPIADVPVPAQEAPQSSYAPASETPAEQ